MLRPVQDSELRGWWEPENLGLDRSLGVRAWWVKFFGGEHFSTVEYRPSYRD